MRRSRTLRGWGIAAGVLGGGLLVASEFTILRSIVVLGAHCETVADPGLVRECTATGGHQHSYALVLLGAAVIALVAIATPWQRTARAAGVGMIAIGLLVAVTALVRDLPSIEQTGIVGASFTQAKAVGGPALWLELAGAGLAVLGGALTLAWARRLPTKNPD